MGDTTDKIKAIVKDQLTNEGIPDAAGAKADDQHWALKVRTRDENFLVDVGTDPVAAQAALDEAHKLMSETGSVKIGGSLVVMASEIESIALQRHP